MGRESSVTYPAPSDPVGSLTRADGTTEAHSSAHGRVIGLWENVLHHGATGDGSTDDATAITAAFTAAGTSGTVFFPPGYTYYVGSTVTFTCNVQGIGAEITYDGASVAVDLGNGTTNVTRPVMFLPSVRYTGTAWTASTVGVRTRGIVQGEIHVQRIRNFEKGLYCTAGTSTPTAYSSFYLQHLDNNKVNLYIDDGSAASYCNENNYFGGRYSHDSAQGTNNAGCHHIQLAVVGSNIPNNHRFWGPSLEGNSHADNATISCDGSNNFFAWCRWEATSPGVSFGANSGDNWVLHGYNSLNLTIADSGSRNRVTNRNSDTWEGSGGADGMLRLCNLSSSANPVLVTIPAGVDPFGNPEATYTTSIAALSTNYKATADTAARLAITSSTGNLAWGDGTNAADTNLYRSAADHLKTDDKLQVVGELELDAALNHDGTTVGFYGVTPATRPTAYTQTYSTADKTHAAPTASTLTVTDGAGTNDNTIGAITADASVIAAVQEIADEINKLVADVADVKQLVNSVIDDLQTLGLVQ